MGTDSRESDDRDIYGVRLGVERVELVLPLWRCRSFDPSLQSEILDAGTLCVASDGGWNLGKGQKVRGAAVVVSSTGNSRGSTGARRRPRRRSGPSRPRPRSPCKTLASKPQIYYITATDARARSLT